MFYQTAYSSPLGQIGIVCSEEALVCLWLPGQPPFSREARICSCPQEHPMLEKTARWLDRYFSGEPVSAAELPVAPEGSEFRRRIWRLLLEIPWGQSRTYGFLASQAAREMGIEKMSAQAVGGAVGSNPISIVIPCHRCLGAGGAITGYAGGLALKRALLELERIPYKDCP